MRHRWIAISIALASFVAFAPAPATAQILKASATLDGAQVVPNKVVTSAHGTVELTGDTTTGQISWNVKLVNLPTGVLAIDVHVGGEGLAGPEIFNLDAPLFWSNEVEFTGNKSLAAATLQPDLGLRSVTDVGQTMFGGQSAYVVVHTEANPAGDIRGQLKRVQ